MIGYGGTALDEVAELVLITQAVLLLPRYHDENRRDCGRSRSRRHARPDSRRRTTHRRRSMDTSTFWANDRSDPIEVVIRDFPSLNCSVFRPDTVIHIRQTIGLLSSFEDGNRVVRWRLLRRGGADITVEAKVTLPT